MVFLTAFHGFGIASSYYTSRLWWWPLGPPPQHTKELMTSNRVSFATKNLRYGNQRKSPKRKGTLKNSVSIRCSRQPETQIRFFDAQIYSFLFQPFAQTVGKHPKIKPFVLFHAKAWFRINDREDSQGCPCRHFVGQLTIFLSFCFSTPHFEALNP